MDGVDESLVKQMGKNKVDGTFVVKFKLPGCEDGGVGDNVVNSSSAVICVGIRNINFWEDGE
ncbi:hypothetical protein LOAG_00651 [Loa loa]|uniref:Uncharacterized protein n=1 Tax=Loa loa TaxID=7209 RepID=A0A1S0UCT1_LOALO|nr:hypothetical protein LOAG_00651 [Loa loa]EFO27838.1 hypothetical protein LOAG_00651 [Loa loa]